MPDNVDADRVQLVSNVGEAQLDGLDLLVKSKVLGDDPVLRTLDLLVNDDASGVKVPDRAQLRSAEDFCPAQFPGTPVAQGKLGAPSFIGHFHERNRFQEIRTVLNNPSIRLNRDLFRPPKSSAVWMTADRRRPFAEELVKMMNRKRFDLPCPDVAKERCFRRNLNSALPQRKEHRCSGQDDHVQILTQRKFCKRSIWFQMVKAFKQLVKYLKIRLAFSVRTDRMKSDRDKASSP